MKTLFYGLLLAASQVACAQQPNIAVQQDLTPQIASTEQELERLKLSLTVLHPTVIQTQRRVWQLESQLPSEARATALQKRLDAQRQRLDSLISNAESNDDSRIQQTRSDVRYLEELIAASTN